MSSGALIRAAAAGKRAARSGRSSSAPLVAFLLPASQDIVALAHRAAQPLAAAVLGIGFWSLLVELGERNAYDFVYFQF